MVGCTGREPGEKLVTEEAHRSEREPLTLSPAHLTLLVGGVAMGTHVVL